MSCVVVGNSKSGSYQQEESLLQQTLWEVIGYAPKCITAVIVASRGLAALGKIQINTALAIESQAVGAYAIPLLTQSCKLLYEGRNAKCMSLMAAAFAALGYSSYVYKSAFSYSTELAGRLVQDTHSIRVIIEEVKVFIPPMGFETISACILGGATLYCVRKAAQKEWMPSRIAHAAAGIFCTLGILNKW